MFLLRGLQNGLSALLGSLAYWVPTCLFVWRVSAYATARASARFVVAFFGGEALKLFLSGALFVLFIKFFPIDLLYAFIGLIGAIIAFWIVSIFSVYRQGVRG